MSYPPAPDRLPERLIFRPGWRALVIIWISASTVFNFVAAVIALRTENTYLAAAYFLSVNVATSLAALFGWWVSRAIHTVEFAGGKVVGPRHLWWDSRKTTRVPISRSSIRHCLKLSSPPFLPKRLQHKYVVICSDTGDEIILDPILLGSAQVERLLEAIRTASPPAR